MIRFPFGLSDEMADEAVKEVFLRAQEEHQRDQEKPGGQDLAWHLRRQVTKLSTAKILSLALSASLMEKFLDARLQDGRLLRSFLYDSIVEAWWPWAK